MDYDCPPPAPSICEVIELGELKKVKCMVYFKCRDALGELVFKEHDKAMKLLREPNDKKTP